MPKFKLVAYLSRIGLSQWVQTMSMVSWVIGGAARPLQALNHSHLPGWTPRLKIYPTFDSHACKYSAHPAGGRWASRFLLSSGGSVAINLSLSSGLPRATKRARLGLVPTVCRRRSESRGLLLGEEQLEV